jgi:hypothetical protein
MMSESPERLPIRTWRPAVAGALEMVAGIWNIIVGIGTITGSLALNIVSPSFLWGYGTYA